jgi:pimeloyl-ACP methyl ester carboxylesterase
MKLVVFALVILVNLPSPNCLAQSASFSPHYGDSERKSFRTGGREIAYVDIGNGAPILLVHGALADYRYWQSLIEAGKDRFRFIAPSLRGAYPDASSGQSPGSDWEDLIVLIDSFGFERVAIVGHSLGGAIAAKIALERPDLVRALVLEEPALISPPAPGENNGPPAVLPFVHLMLAGEIESGVKGFIDLVSGLGTYDRFSLPERQFLLDNYRTVTEGSGPPLIACADISKLTVPVLYVKGEISPFAENPSEECIPNRIVTTIPNASHGIHYENPAAFNARALEFLQR